MDNGYNKEAREILLSGMQKQKILKSLPPHDVNCEYWCKHDKLMENHVIGIREGSAFKESTGWEIAQILDLKPFDTCRSAQLEKKKNEV